jgi:hypothetical protein
MGDQAALQLTCSSSAEEVVQRIRRGKGHYPLCCGKVHRSVKVSDSQVRVNLILVHVSHVLTVAQAIPWPEYTNRRRCLPAPAQDVYKTAMGDLVVSIAGKQITCEYRLILAEGSQDPEREQRGDDVYVCNKHVFDLSLPNQTHRPRYSSSCALAIRPHLQSLSGPEGAGCCERCETSDIGQVTELHAVAVLASSAEAQTAFQAEMLHVSTLVTGTPSRKRAWKDIGVDYVSNVMCSRASSS